VGLRRRPLAALALCPLLLAASSAFRAPAAGAIVRRPGPTGHEAPGRPARGTTTTTTSTTLPGQGTTVLEDGGAVTIAVPSIPTDFNPSVPAGANRVDQMVTEQVWPQPFVVDRSSSTVLDTSFVTSAYLTSVSPQTITYSIANGARWSDGVPITSADFAYMWREQLRYGPELPANDPITGYQDITSVTGSNGGRTVTVVFARPYSDWEALFANLVPAHVASVEGFAAAFAGTSAAGAVSGGPYEITKVVPRSEVVLARNPHYWGPPAHVATIVFREVRGDRAVIAAVGSGRVDIGQVSPGPATSALLASHPTALASGTILSPTLWQVAMNLARPTLSQPAFRTAIAKAIDRTEILADTVGLATPTSPISGNRLFPAGAPSGRGNDGGYVHADVGRTDELLTGLGYTVDPTGRVLGPSGAPLQLTLTGPTGSPLAATTEALLQAQFLQAGITLHVRNVPESQLLAVVLPSGEYELALAPYMVTPFPSESEALYTDPVGPTAVNLAAASAASPTTLPGALPGHARATDLEPGAVVSGAVSRDVLGFSDPGVTALYLQAEESLAPPAAADVYNSIDAALWQDLPTVPLFQVPVTLVTRANILNIANTDTWAGPMWDAENWVIEAVPPATTAPGG